MSDFMGGWDYEDWATPPYYHIYGEIGNEFIVLTIEQPQTPENDADIQAITDHLRAIAGRLP